VSDRVRRHRARWSHLLFLAVLVGSVVVDDILSPPAFSLATLVRTGPATFYCTNPQRTSTIQGHPDLTSVPPLEAVGLAPRAGGLLVTFKFHKPFALAPEGVYISWSVFVFRHRSDAQSTASELQLQVEDRGKGWQPTGWTILAALGKTNDLVGGQVHTNPAHNEFSTFFPGGFGNLDPPFYWFASQEEYRAYLPTGNKAASQDWTVYGASFTDCPAGVRPDPYSLPYGAKLLTVAG
jgi:hypothetical protein